MIDNQNNYYFFIVLISNIWFLSHFYRLLDKIFISMIDKKVIGQNIKNIRYKLGLSQDEFSSKIFISRSSLSKIENGKQLIDLDLSITISETFNVPLSEILKGSYKENKESTINSNYKFKVYFNISLLSLILILLLFQYFYSLSNKLYYNQVYSSLWRYFKFDQPYLILFNLLFYFLLILEIISFVLLIRSLINVKKFENSRN